jgi:chromosomal replication initiation ATPase DnaA
MRPRSVEAIVKDLDLRDLLELASKIALEHHVTLEEMLSRSRRPPECDARFHFWAELYELIPSVTKIGDIVGRDHTSVSAGIRAHRGIHRKSSPRVKAAKPIEPNPWTKDERTGT